ncbi:hypothetical protein HYT00_02455 [Candidatus Giovannonibacteria bacterium]|nr:hypothetical protein [Candidatus Giovannonibacteria bacterium]
MQIQRYLACLVLFFVLIASGSLVTFEKTSWFGRVNYNLDSYSSVDAFSESSQRKYANISGVSGVAYHEVANPWAVAYVIPQIHKDPSLDSSNPGNNDAEAAQREIYGIIKSLRKNFDVNVVAVEGELKDDLISPKIDDLAKKMKNKDAFQKEANELSRKIPEYARPAFNSRVASFIDGIDREIWLKGAPYKLSAEGYPINIYGLENPGTREEATEIVRKYVYLQDRVSQGQNTSKIGQIFSLLPMGKEGRMKRDLQTIGVRVDGASSITKNMLQNLEALVAKPVSAKEKKVPSRADNPYMSLSPVEAKEMLRETEGQIQQIVSVKRSNEAAENFADILRKKNKTSGIIQFGAAHVDDIVKKLNSEGISAVVISPDKVAKPNNVPSVSQLSRLEELRTQLKSLDRDSLLRMLISKRK